MKRIIRIEQSQSARFNLTWVINNICPNACSYCPDNLHNGTNHNYDWVNAERFIREVIRRHGNIRCTITGGEPTLSPFLPELIDLIHQHGGLTFLTSNGYRNSEYWMKVAPKLSWIGFSYHPEFTTDRYFKNLSIASKLTRVDARVMMLSSHWDQCVEVYNRLSASEYHSTSAIRIVNWLGDANNGTDSYTDDQLDWFSKLKSSTSDKHKHLDKTRIEYTPVTAHMDDKTIVGISDATKYINTGMTNFKGYTCEIGIKSLLVNQAGEIWRGNCLEGGPIGHINDPDSVHWPTAAVICSYDSCTCATDVRINKWINE